MIQKEERRRREVEAEWVAYREEVRRAWAVTGGRGL